MSSPILSLSSAASIAGLATTPSSPPGACERIPESTIPENHHAVLVTACHSPTPRFLHFHDSVIHVLMLLWNLPYGLASSTCTSVVEGLPTFPPFTMSCDDHLQQRLRGLSATLKPRLIPN
eukprot:6484901-Amphidinium_carterae.1